MAREGRAVRLLLPVLLALLLAGCWDRIEIDQRGFVVGVGIDRNKGKGVSRETSGGMDKYMGTYQMVVPSGLKAGDSKGPAGGKAYFNISATENSMHSLTGKLSTKTSRAPYFEHLKLIIISSEVARTREFADILDFFLRDNEMRRNVKIMVSEGRAEQVLNVLPLSENMPVNYIESTAKNKRKSNYMLPESRIGDVHEHMLTEQSFTVQKVVPYEEGVSLTGSALFDGRNKRMVAFLSGEETQALNFLRGEVTGGIVETEISGRTVDLEVERAKRKIEVNWPPGGTPVFSVYIQVEGTLGKSFAKLDLTNSPTISDIEAKLNARIEEGCRKLLKVLQKKYGKDAAGLGAHLREEHYKQWTAIEDNWEYGEELFRSAQVHIQSDVKIRRIGSINANEEERGQ
ncbi:MULTISPECIES: Ger(x)C family spore germination protein [Paenibacillus]|uniref:Ger(x)C family spore germination protein n=1 Tax=Paenibacillus TaxID=44249 RepID=UPI0022B894D2|nr:Ger(x)C family spore germination protein [Paenibacillus caseinilyticus]MCZ8520787.1 Ger(x)C family spore germination protein [Paenibacillus caseinilyticus]